MPSISDCDLIALMDQLGVPSAWDLDAEWEALLAADTAVDTAVDAAAADTAPGDTAPGDTAATDTASGDTAARVRELRLSAAELAEQLPAGPGSASLLAVTAPTAATNWELPGIAASCRRLAAWAQAGELAAVAEIAARAAAANSRIPTGENGCPQVVPPEAAAQVALQLQMSQPGAAGWVDLAMQLRWRLPATGAALSAATIDLGRARIIAEGTSVLPDELARAVEDRVLPAASDQTTGQLRGAVRRAVIAVDPEGAEQRRADAERRAKVSLYPDEEGTATLTGTGLPGVHAAAAMARITAMARALKSSGASGGLDLLRAHILLGLILGTMPLIPPPADGPPDGPQPPDDDTPGTPPADTSGAGDPADGGPAPDSVDDTPASDTSRAGDPPDGSSPDDRRPDDSRPDDSRPDDSPSDLAPSAGDGPSAAGGPSPGDGPDELRGQLCLSEPWPDIPAPGDADAPPDDGDCLIVPAIDYPEISDTEDDDRAEQPSPSWPTLPARLPAGRGPGSQNERVRPPSGLLDVLVPWSVLAGISSEPARLGRIGPVTPLQARQLLFLAARSRATQWRVVLTDDSGRALAVERARPGWRPDPKTDDGSTGVIGRVTIAVKRSWLSSQRAGPPTATGATDPLADITAMILRAAARADIGTGTAVGTCTHNASSAAYRPPARIREQVAARDVTCRFGPCGQPAWRGDLDHTIPWQQGGLTCACNLGGHCRTHHKIKQLPGWHLEQPEPGTFRWTTPAGRTYLVQPDSYPT